MFLYICSRAVGERFTVTAAEVVGFEMKEGGDGVGDTHMVGEHDDHDDNDDDDHYDHETGRAGSFVAGLVFGWWGLESSIDLCVPQAAWSSPWTRPPGSLWTGSRITSSPSRLGTSRCPEHTLHPHAHTHTSGGGGLVHTEFTAGGWRYAKSPAKRRTT